MIHIEKLNTKKPISAVYWDGDKEQFNVKRFFVEMTKRIILFISEHENSYLEIASTEWKPVIEIIYRKTKGKEKEPKKIDVAGFISIKGLKAIGKRLTTEKVKMINSLDPLPAPEKEATSQNEEISDDHTEDSPTQVRIDFE